jgi:hypothetical protein
MTIDFAPLEYEFRQKPLLVGGKAKEYHGVRKAGNDTDLIVGSEDYAALAERFPYNLADIWGDLGVKVHGFEIWKTIRKCDYAFLSEGAQETDRYLIISLDKLLYLTALAMNIPKYHDDLELIVKKVLERKYQDPVIAGSGK